MWPSLGFKPFSTKKPHAGAPEAVLDWGGGGGQRTKGAHDISVRGSSVA